MTTTLEGGERSASRPGRSLPRGKSWYPLYRRLGGPQGRSGQVRKISPPPGFDPRTVQPVASRYTNYATRPTIFHIYTSNLHEDQESVWGTRWCSWLKHCTKSRKIAGSIPDGVTAIFHWHNLSDRTMALGLAQSLTEMSTRNISWG